MAERRLSPGWSRREVLGGLALAGAAAATGWRPGPARAAGDPPPETTTLRLRQWRPACWAPLYVAEPLLREEGFERIEWVTAPGPETVQMLRDGEIDLLSSFSALDMNQVDRFGHPLTFLSGLHVGCFALLGSERIGSVRDLKGRTVWTGSIEDNGPHIYFKSIVAYVGLDPDTDITYAWVGKDEATRLFQEGRIDGYMSFPPGPQELIERGIGRVLLDTNVDKPWSQYFCCMISGQSDFVRHNPVAVKRAVRAILRANDIVARDPELTLRVLMEKGIWKQSETRYILRALREIPYGVWREFNPEETIRFYALRLREVGMLSVSPEEFIARHCDWSILRGMREELALKW